MLNSRGQSNAKAKSRTARQRASKKSVPVKQASQDTETIKSLQNPVGVDSSLDNAPSQYPSHRTRHSKIGKNTVVMCIWVMVLTMANLFGLATEETVEVLLPDTGWARILAHWLAAMLLVAPIMLLLRYLASLEESEILRRATDRANADLGTQARYGMTAEQALELRNQLFQKYMEEEYRKAVKDVNLRDPMVGLFRTTMAAKHEEYMQHHPHLDASTVRTAARMAQKSRHEILTGASSTVCTESSRDQVYRY